MKMLVGFKRTASIILICAPISMLFAMTPEGDEAIDYWAKEFNRSTLTHSEIVNELEWFRQSAKKFKGKRIRSVAEGIKTHYWERDVLARAFHEVTGILVDHDIRGEGAVVDFLMKQLTSGKNTYDIYVSDADLIGTHMRIDGTVNLTRYMNEEGKEFTNPNLDLDDFMNLEFSQDNNGNQLQLPDQQFANLYWFRHDWFSRSDIKHKFRQYTVKKYGQSGAYDLGVPLNWAA
ncbi:MAG: carbohydrate ABC transporter substrate-binding protein, partial [Oleispira sp.]|nr:carbohydrate ABC transporter substrate-binding protein [Oleispira sp.]